MTQQYIESSGRKYMMIPLDKMFVDPEYQRDFSEHKVNTILKRFNPMAIRTIVVSNRRDGRYAIIDGQHRVAAIRERSEATEVMCEVHEGLSIKQEAKLYEILNDAKPLSGIDLLRAQYKSGDSRAQEIVDTLEKFGFLILVRGKTRKDDKVVTCASTLTKIHKIGYETLVSTFEVITKAYRNKDGSIDRTSTYSDFLMGMAIVLKKYHKEENNWIIRKLKSSKICPADINSIGNSNNTKEGKRNGRKLADDIARVIQAILDDKDPFHQAIGVNRVREHANN